MSCLVGGEILLFIGEREGLFVCDLSQHLKRIKKDKKGLILDIRQCVFFGSRKKGG